jgi:RNase P protein component
MCALHSVVQVSICVSSHGLDPKRHMVGCMHSRSSSDLSKRLPFFMSTCFSSGWGDMVFVAVIDSGRRVILRHFRVAFSMLKKTMGNDAVVRNRGRRRLKEAARLFMPDLAPKGMVLLIVVVTLSGIRGGKVISFSLRPTCHSINAGHASLFRLRLCVDRPNTRAEHCLACPFGRNAGMLYNSSVSLP